MKEYKVVTYKTSEDMEKRLNELAQQGWTFTSFIPKDSDKLVIEGGK